MKKLNISKITDGLKKIKSVTNKHLPKILVGVGATSTVAGTILACRATLKADTILADAKDSLEDLDTQSETYTDDKKQIKKSAAIGIVKQYALPVTLVGGGITCMLSGHGILEKRHATLAGAYTALTAGFEKYRDNVISRFGEQVDKELRLGLKEKRTEVQEVTEIDENGNEIKRTETVNVVDGKYIDEDLYTFRFDSRSPYWNKHSMDYNFMFIREIEAEANVNLVGKGTTITVMPYLERLGIKPNSVSALVGWIHNKDLDDNSQYRQVSFGIDWHNQNDSLYRDEVTGENFILLDMKVDGAVIDWLDIPKEYIEFRRFNGSTSQWLEKSRMNAGLAVTDDEIAAATSKKILCYGGH